MGIRQLLDHPPIPCTVLPPSPRTPTLRAPVILRRVHHSMRRRHAAAAANGIHWEGSRPIKPLQTLRRPRRYRADRLAVGLRRCS